MLIIGKEFEVLIDSHGPEHVTQLMQKVISSLEHLEKLAALGDEERDTIENLKTTITHLELEGTKKNEERQRNYYFSKDSRIFNPYVFQKLKKTKGIPNIL